MPDIRPFKAVRPNKDVVSLVAALPYDVYSSSEAREAVKERPLSFLNIDRPETMFPVDHDMYADDVYDAARERYLSQKREGVYVTEKKPCYYIYELTMQERSQTGIAALSSVDDYLEGICKKHENTTKAKERDRIHHIDTLSAQTGPILLAYHADKDIDRLVDEEKQTHRPLYDFISEDRVVHRVWMIDDDGAILKLRDLFGKIGCTYIADGHHRAASAVKVALKRRKEALGKGKVDPDAEYNFFLSVLFPDKDLRILDYNRVVKDLNGFKKEDFLKKLEDTFDVEETGSVNLAREEKIAGSNKDQLERLLKPTRKYEIGMYLDKKTYKLRLKEDMKKRFKIDPVKSLDVSVLQEEVLSKLLSIHDPRTDQRIKFVGGIRGISALVKDVDGYTKKSQDKGTFDDRGPAVSFVMYPTSISELFKVADSSLLMPPKSTWFEPKLRSGIFIHEF